MNPRHRDFQSLALPTELPAHEIADMLGRVKIFVELFIEQAGIIKQLGGMSKILLCHVHIFVSMSRIAGLTMKIGPLLPEDRRPPEPRIKSFRQGHLLHHNLGKPGMLPKYREKGKELSQ